MQRLFRPKAEYRTWFYFLKLQQILCLKLQKKLWRNKLSLHPVLTGLGRIFIHRKCKVSFLLMTGEMSCRQKNMQRSTTGIWQTHEWKMETMKQREGFKWETNRAVRSRRRNGDDAEGWGRICEGSSDTKTQKHNGGKRSYERTQAERHDRLEVEEITKKPGNMETDGMERRWIWSVGLWKKTDTNANICVEIAKIFIRKSSNCFLELRT